MDNYKICNRCIYDERIGGFSLDKNGVCNYCKFVDDLKLEYGTGSDIGIKKIEEIITKIKARGLNNKYDCVVGVSGGTDSSYMLFWAKQHGLRPLAVHYDNTWNNAIATENIRKVLQKLDIDLYTHVTDNKEADDIYKSFFLSGLPDIEASTDLAYAEVLNRVASKFKIKYTLEGHSFTEEGVSPLTHNYFDGKYIKTIHKLFGKRKMVTYPLMTFMQFMKWTLFFRIKKIRPYWYIKYDKKSAMDFLEKECDWKYYGGHHLENRMTSFYHSVLCPQRFGQDFRINTLAAQVRNGKKEREIAIQEYNTPPFVEPELVEYFKKRLGLTDELYFNLMNQKKRYWWEFKSYKRRFELLRPMFYLFYKSNLVYKSFYLKYCFPVKIEK